MTSKLCIPSPKLAYEYQLGDESKFSTSMMIHISMVIQNKTSFLCSTSY